LLLLAGSYVDDPKPGSVAKAITYSQKALTVAKADAPDADKPRKISGAAALDRGLRLHEARQNCCRDSGVEISRATAEGQDDAQYSVTPTAWDLPMPSSIKLAKLAMS